MQKKHAPHAIGNGDHAIAFRDIRHGGAGFFDHAHELMAEHHVFELRKEAVVDVQIGAADRGRCDTDNYVLRIFDAWIIHVIDFDMAGPVKYECFHRFLRMVEFSRLSVAREIASRQAVVSRPGEV